MNCAHGLEALGRASHLHDLGRVLIVGLVEVHQAGLRQHAPALQPAVRLAPLSQVPRPAPPERIDTAQPGGRGTVTRWLPSLDRLFLLRKCFYVIKAEDHTAAPVEQIDHLRKDHQQTDHYLLL